MSISLRSKNQKKASGNGFRDIALSYPNPCMSICMGEERFCCIDVVQGRVVALRTLHGQYNAFCGNVLRRALEELASWEFLSVDSMPLSLVGELGCGHMSPPLDYLLHRKAGQKAIKIVQVRCLFVERRVTLVDGVQHWMGGLFMGENGNWRSRQWGWVTLILDRIMEPH